MCGVCVCERERERDGVLVCVCEREREKWSLSVWGVGGVCFNPEVKNFGWVILDHSQDAW